MNAAATANAYKQQQIMTATPEELTLMLYNGALKFLSECATAMENKEMEKAHNSNLRVQAIVGELNATLDKQYEISQGYAQLYDFVLYKLIEANIHKNPQNLEDAKVILTDLRDAWFQAMKQVRTQQPQGVPQYA